MLAKLNEYFSLSYICNMFYTIGMLACKVTQYTFFFVCGAAAQSGPWPPHPRGF